MNGWISKPFIVLHMLSANFHYLSFEVQRKTKKKNSWKLFFSVLVAVAWPVCLNLNIFFIAIVTLAFIPKRKEFNENFSWSQGMFIKCVVYGCTESKEKSSKNSQLLFRSGQINFPGFPFCVILYPRNWKPNWSFIAFPVVWSFGFGAAYYFTNVC